MNIILLGYNGLLGNHILENLAQKLKNTHHFKVICVGRKIKNKPVLLGRQKFSRILYKFKNARYRCIV